MIREKFARFRFNSARETETFPSQQGRGITIIELGQEHLRRISSSFNPSGLCRFCRMCYAASTLSVCVVETDGGKLLNSIISGSLFFACFPKPRRRRRHVEGGNVF